MPLPRAHIPSTAALRVLETFDRLGTTIATGDALGLTQSAVSRQLKTLEEQLGVALFHREGRNLVLSAAAQAYAAEAREALARLTQAGMRLRAPVDHGGSTSPSYRPSGCAGWCRACPSLPAPIPR